MGCVILNSLSDLSVLPLWSGVDFLKSSDLSVFLHLSCVISGKLSDLFDLRQIS